MKIPTINNEMIFVIFFLSSLTLYSFSIFRFNIIIFFSHRFGHSLIVHIVSDRARNWSAQKPEKKEKVEEKKKLYKKKKRQVMK